MTLKRKRCLSLMVVILARDIGLPLPLEVAGEDGTYETSLIYCL